MHRWLWPVFNKPLKWVLPRCSHFWYALFYNEANKAVDLFLILTWHDLHAFDRSQQARAISPSSGSSAVYFCWWKCEDVSEGGVQTCREEIDDVVWYWRAKLMCVSLRSVWTQLCDICKKCIGVLFLVYVWIMYFFKVKKKYSRRGNQHQDVAQNTMEKGVEGAEKLVCP